MQNSHADTNSLYQNIALNSDIKIYGAATVLTCLTHKQN